MLSTNQYIEDETRRALYIQAPAANVTVMVISGLYLFILWDHLPRELLLIWTALMWCSSALRLSLWHRQKKSPATSTQWIRSYSLASTWVGVSWSLIYLALFSLDNLIVNIALIMLVFGIVSSALPILSVHPPAFIGYSVPQIWIFIVAMLSHQAPSFYLLALAALVYQVMLLLFMRNSFRMFRDSVQLAAENRSLVSELNDEIERRETIINARTRELLEENQVRKNTEQELIEQKESYVHLAHHDPLTGLPNRALMTQRLELAIAASRREKSQSAVMFLDLDRFKDVNDSLGHSTGDELLRAVASRLTHAVRKDDTVARIGGDEFTLIIKSIDDPDSVSRLAQKLLDRFRLPIQLSERTIRITPSIGISLFPDDGDDAEILLRNADTAMYQAKAEGRNTIRFYSTELTRFTRERMTMESELREAIEQDQLRLVWQPQYELKSGRLIGAEALLRWHHPDKGDISPGLFIPVAEASELIVDIGNWVLLHALQAIKNWDAVSHGLRLAVNISGRQIIDSSLATQIETLAADIGCDLGGLEIEITEGFLVSDPEKTRETLGLLKQMDIQVAVDDFGTGYSSLSYLKQFEIDKIKIDQAFVREIHVDPNDQAITDAIIALGSKLGLTVIAEGVETAEQAQYLLVQGCNEVQGYYYSRPLEEELFEELLVEKAQANRAS